MRKALFVMAAVMLTVSCCLAQGPREGKIPVFGISSPSESRPADETDAHQQYDVDVFVIALEEGPALVNQFWTRDETGELHNHCYLLDGLPTASLFDSASYHWDSDSMLHVSLHFAGTDSVRTLCLMGWKERIALCDLPPREEPEFTMQPLAVGQYTTYLQWDKGSNEPFETTIAIVGRDDSTWTVEMRYFDVPFAQGKVVGLEEAIATGDPKKARLVAHRYDGLKWRWGDHHQKTLDNLLQFNMLGPALKPETQLRRVEHASSPCGEFPQSISDVWDASTDNGSAVRCIAWRSERVPLSGIVKLENVSGKSRTSYRFQLVDYGADFDTSGYTRAAEAEKMGEKAFCDSLIRRNATLSPGQYVRYATWTEHEDVPTLLTIAVVGREQEGPVCEIRLGEEVIQFLVTGIEQARRTHDKRKVRVRWCRSRGEEYVDEREQVVLSDKHTKLTDEEWENISYFLDLGMFGEILPVDMVRRQQESDYFFWLGGLHPTAEASWYIGKSSGAAQYCLAKANPVIPISGLTDVHTVVLPRAASTSHHSERRSRDRHISLLDFGYDARPSF